MKQYIIKKIIGPVTAESFEKAEVAKIDCRPWPEFSASYNTEARLLYTDEALYVNLRTDETVLRAHQTERDSSVCDDSCMELFISFNEKDPRYFNFEVNPLGTLLLHLGTGRKENSSLPDDEKLFEIKSIITGEGWSLFYKIPFSFVLQYFETVSDEIRGNFYKCGDLTIQEHYAVWNPIDTETPDYHRPEFFGKLIFEKGAPC